MGDHRPHRSADARTGWRIAGVATVAAVVAVSMMHVLGPARPPSPSTFTPLLGVAAAVTALVLEEAVVVFRPSGRYAHRRRMAWQLDGVAATIAVVALPAWYAIVTIVLAQAIVAVVVGRAQGRPLFKSVFNGGQKVVAAVAAVLVLSAVTQGAPVTADTRSLAGLLAAAATYEVGTWLFVATVIAITSEPSGRRRALTVPFWSGLAAIPGNVVYAAVCALLWHTTPWMLPVIVVPVVMQHMVVGRTLTSLDRAMLTVEERDRLQATVAGVADGVVLVSPEGTPLVVSPSVATLLDVVPESLTGRVLEDLLPLADQRIDELMAGLSADEPTCEVHDASLVRSPGATVPVNVRLAGVFDDHRRLSYVVVVVHDRTRDLEVARVKDAFLAQVSHELRTPLSPVLSYAQLLRQHRARLDAHEVDRALDEMVDQTRHLTALVDDLLLVSQLASGALPRESLVTLGDVDVDSTVAAAVREVAAAWSDHQIQVTTAAVTARADPLRLRQVVGNLVGNACKYSPTGSVVRIDVTADDSRVLLSVHDEGSGIDPDEVDRIFEPFYRVAGRVEKGAGVGLHLVQQFLHAMDGSISVASRPGRGSTFTVAIPRSVPDAEGTGVATAPEAVPDPA